MKIEISEVVEYLEERLKTHKVYEETYKIVKCFMSSGLEREIGEELKLILNHFKEMSKDESR